MNGQDEYEKLKEFHNILDLERHQNEPDMPERKEPTEEENCRERESKIITLEHYDQKYFIVKGLAAEFISGLRKCSVTLDTQEMLALRGLGKLLGFDVVIREEK